MSPRRRTAAGHCAAPVRVASSRRGPTSHERRIGGGEASTREYEGSVGLHNRLEGLRDEEFWWEPEAGCWNIQRAGEEVPGAFSVGGDWAIDGLFSYQDLPPFTTIGWRLNHMAIVIAGYHSSVTPRRSDSYPVGMTEKLTLMAVHAHPDDEATSTGGVLARYSDEGLRTVVVTCTNGELGDLPGGIKPDADGHDEELVVQMRTKELEQACKILGVADLEMLGYRDSGMADWEHKGHADAFCNVPLEEATDRLCKLFEIYKPDVVVTYDVDSVYNHPDHVQASRVTSAAVERTGIPQKSYFTAMRSNRWTRIREILEKEGVELPSRPQPSPEMIERMQAMEDKITTVIDVSPFADRKLEALRAHVSQIQDSFWSKLPPAALDQVFSEECFVYVTGTTDIVRPENDLFAGLR